ncbi:MAG: excinuclease ABC subunit UvrC [Fibrobacter sp.]|nr:excinuclease ABC subunit UvrC [Fibrobacter sp.]
MIYIGKAKSLNKRVRSYFDGRQKSGHRAAGLMLPHIADIEWVITETEQEALVLEANLIRKHSPRYNVRQKDDKRFPYLMVTLNEAFPRVLVVRRVRDDGNAYFGPFLNSRAMRSLLELLPRLFRIRECDLKLPLKSPIRPCLAWHIKRCDAPCAHKFSQEQYAMQVDLAMRLLEGKREDLLTEWREQMQSASQKMAFEEAARLRDQIAALNALTQKQDADVADAGVNLDVVAVRRSGTIGCVVILEYRSGKLAGRRHFVLDCELEQDEGEILAEFLPGWYLDAGTIPRELVVEVGWEDMELTAATFSAHAGRKVRLHIPQRGEKVRYLRLAQANAEMILVEQKAQQIKYDEINRAVFELQNELQLAHTPLNIECFDISHLQGTDTVASMVSFKNGRSYKSGYRRYKIKSVDGVDDYASMREVVGRRLERLLNEEKALPDLLVIDGGRGQVEAAWAVVKSLGIAELPVIGLAERLEEVYRPGTVDVLSLKRNSPALKLLQKMRDEAHRFALSYQRKLRMKRMQVQWLQNIPGVGPKTQNKILRKWKTKRGFLAASEAEKVEYLGIKVWEKLKGIK